MSAHALSPYYSRYRSPFGDILALFGNAQATHRCREFELNVLDCTDVYGHKGLLKQCLVPYEDFHECLYETKQNLRVNEMRKERMRQYLNGDRSKKNLYREPPNAGSSTSVRLKIPDSNGQERTAETCDQIIVVPEVTTDNISFPQF